MARNAKKEALKKKSGEAFPGAHFAGATIDKMRPGRGRTYFRKALIKKETEARFAKSPYAAKYREKNEAREMGRHATRTDKHNALLKRK